MSMMDRWRASGMPEHEVLRREGERRDLVAATRARTMMLRKEREAQAAGLGDAVMVAHEIVKAKSSLDREFRQSPLKGTRHQTTVVKKVQHRQRLEEKFKDRQENPRIKGLAGVPGVTTDADGRIGLRKLREQRPDIFEAEPLPIDGFVPKGKIALAKAARNRGKKDKYDHLLND